MNAPEIDVGRQGAIRLARAPASGLLWLGIAAVGAVVFSWSGLASLPEAWARPEYSHGYLIPPIALFLLVKQLQRDREDWEARPARRGLGIAVGLFGLVLGLFGNLVQIPDIITYGLIVSVAGLMLVTMGTSRGLRFWVPVFYLTFMLPLPNFIYWPLSIKLQLISSEIGVAIIALLGVPVLLDGNIIDLGVYKLQVAEACSGLRYLFPLASFSFLFAVLYKGPVWHKIVLVLSALPITVLLNSFRIGVIGILVDRYGIGQAEGFLHFFEGWVIFLGCVVVLYLEAVLLQRLTRKPVPIHRMLEIDFSSVVGQFRRIGNIESSRALTFLSVVTVLAGLGWHLAPIRSTIEPQRLPLALFSMQIEGWSGTTETLDRDVERVLAADDYLIANYANEEAVAPVNLFIAFYKSQTEGSGIHSPEVCIPTGGWEVSRWATADTGVRMPSGGQLTVNRAIIQRGLSQQLVYYWFEQRGRHLTSDYVTKAYTVWDSMTRRRTDGALVRVVTPIAVGEGEDAASLRLRQFLQLTVDELQDYVPG